MQKKDEQKVIKNWAYPVLESNSQIILSINGEETDWIGWIKP